MRTAARRAPQDEAALDMIFDAGQRARDLEIMQAQLEEAKRKLAPPPLRKRVWGLVSSILVFGFTAFVFYLIGEYRAATIMENRAPLPTAGVPTRTALPPPRDPPMTFGGASAPAEPAPAAVDPTPAWPDDGGADLQAAPVAPEPAPGVASEEAIEAWLSAPPSTPTPLPEPGQPGFAASFEEAPACSPFIGYLAGSECARFFTEQTAIAAGE